LLSVPGRGSNIGVELLEVSSEIKPVSGLVARQSHPEASQSPRDIAQDRLNFLLLSESKAVCKIFVLIQKIREEFLLTASEMRCMGGSS